METEFNAAEYVRTHGLRALGEYLEQRSRRPRILYNVGSDLMAVEQLLMEAEGVLDDDVARLVDEWMDHLTVRRDELLDGMGTLYQEVSARGRGRAAEAKRFAQLAESDTRVADGVRERIRAFMERTGVDRPIQTARCKLSLRSNGGVAGLDWKIGASEYYLLPDALRETVYVPRTDAVRRAVSAGVEARNARLSAMQADLGFDTTVRVPAVLSDVAHWFEVQHGENDFAFDAAADYLTHMPSDEAWSVFVPEVRDIINKHYPPTDAERILDLVELKPRGNHVRIE